MKSINYKTSTIKQTQEYLNTVWNRVGISEDKNIWLHTDELNNLRRAKDERNSTVHPLQKAAVDKVKE